MLLATPKIDAGLRSRLAELDELRHRLDESVAGPEPWVGALRRQARASSAEGSVSIEGFAVAAGEALALVGGERPVEGSDRNRMAVACYGRAMDHAGVMATDPSFRWLDRVILDLHFDACSFQPEARPGRWRDGSIAIGGSEGRLVYRAPEAEDVPNLMAAMVEWLERGDLDAHVVVRAAMAHLHLISVHPFADGNGRISRIVQALVLARDGLLPPELGSIEDHIASHAGSYYAALNEAHGPTYDPDRDASGWVAFCVEAHLAQVGDHLARAEDAAGRWARLETPPLSGRGGP